jgi:hypothetical protein
VLQSETPLCGLSLRLFAFNRKVRHEPETTASNNTQQQQELQPPRALAILRSK